MSLELFWLGQSGFRLRDPAGGPIVFCDPFLSPNPDRTWPAPLGPAELAEQADVVLVTHEHIDHFDQPALQAAAAHPSSRFSLVLPRPLIHMATDLGIAAERIVGAEPDAIIELAGMQVHPVPACHGVNVQDAYTFGGELSNGQVRFLGYVLQLGGLRLYHAGDCVPYQGQRERLTALHPNLACLPINGRDFYRETEQNMVGNMDFREAARLAHDIGADVLVPMHWELFPGNRGFPGDLVAFAADHFPALTVLVMGRGARVSVLPSGG